MTSSNTTRSDGTKTDRRPYDSPRLTVFGMVKSLTASGSANGKEMTNIMAMG